MQAPVTTNRCFFMIFNPSKEQPRKVLELNGSFLETLPAV
ncbi:MAG: hypothetical protein AVDCRST_MAG86-674 [uncultured Truepera sp.]|uniref:Uncharacterized protein n=1 Tax=uncultured Truepera sp. TaxID=543023 RepID=A0A6J4UTT9_9DEIN|nr:MAG: hypothetical protein AVDCRST_MAG86-674 [uncultured Truepera sp.]